MLSFSKYPPYRIHPCASCYQEENTDKALDVTETGEPPLDWCSDEDLEAIRECKTLLENGTDSLIKRITFYPEYGSALCVLSPNEMVGEVSILVLGLDNHEFYVHPNGEKGPECYDHLAVAKDYKPLFVGLVLESELNNFMKLFKELLSEAQLRTGNQRSANFNKQGHQKTPAFILAIAKQALLNTGTSEEPKGGFTDNGLHTGGRPRNTCFPLVRSLLNFRLSQAAAHQGADSLFQRLVTFFDLRVADEYLKIGTVLGSDVAYGCKRMNLDKAMKILETASRKFSFLDEVILLTDGLLQYAKHVKSKIEETLKSSADFERSRFSLKHLQNEMSRDKPFRNPRIRVGGRPSPHPSSSASDIRENTRRNIGLLPIYSWKSGLDIQRMHDWCLSPQFSPCTSLVNGWLLLR